MREVAFIPPPRTGRDFPLPVLKPPDDGYRQNILSTSFNLTGIDVLVDAYQNVWLTEDFAQV